MKTASLPKVKAKRSVAMLDLKRQYDSLRHDIDRAIRNCLEHQCWILGPEVREFENSMASYLGVSKAIGVSSGTDALVLALRALAVRKTGRESFPPGTKILTTSFTFTATGDAILRSGAMPLFVDIDPATFNLDAAKLEEYLRSLKPEEREQIAGILPVHLFGRCADMERIGRLSQKYGLFVLEDAAQSCGAGYAGKKIGTLGHAAAFSFFPSKNLGGFGDGGLVATDDDDIARLVGMLLKHGGESKYKAEYLGYNARLDALQAAILNVKLRHLDSFNQRRRKLAQCYLQGLRAVEGLLLPAPPENSDEHVYNQFTLRILDGKRDRVATALRDRGVETQIYYQKALHQMPLFAERAQPASSGLPETERACREVLSLPMDPAMGQTEAEYVIDAVRQSLNQVREVSS